MRERMQMHHQSPTCASCHSLFEPIGIALENFDGIGAWRVQDEGQPIDTRGSLADGTQINGPTSLRAVLERDSDQFVRVVSEKLLTYALGRGMDDQDMPMVRAVARAAQGSGYRFSTLILGVVTSAPFQHNIKGSEISPVATH